MSAIVHRFLASVAVGACVAVLVVGSALGSNGLPILAGPWGMGQKGYGQLKPTTIFNGGDPTGLVRHIHWLSWGGSRAIGSGTAEYLGPHQNVAQGTQQSARIVLFQLGHCRGRRAYDAIEWYFPQHGEHFDAHRYINACTGAYYPIP